MNRRCFGKEKVGTVKRKIAVYLIGGYLMIARNFILVAGVKQNLSAEDVSLEEHLGVLDRTVNVTFRCKVYDCVKIFLLAECKDGFSVRDIAEHKAKIALASLIQCVEIARIGQSVDANQTVVRVLALHIINEITADKSGAAGDKNVFHIKSPLEIVEFIIHYKYKKEKNFL